MTAVDTSVVVPALLSWHEHHDRCHAIATNACIPAHAFLETYSVMTRLPSPHRLSPATAGELLGGWFTADQVLLTPASVQRRLVGRAGRLGIVGGAAYDALVGLTARHHRQVLVTRDSRALHTYASLDVDVQFMES